MAILVHIDGALPPTVNHMYVMTRHGGRALSADAQQWRELVAATVRQAGYRAAPDGELTLIVRISFGNRRRQDLDNRLKAAIDALALALGFDDSRIAQIIAERRHGSRPGCELRLDCWTAEEDGR